MFKNKFKFGARCLQAVQAVHQTHKQYMPRNLKFYLTHYTLLIVLYFYVIFRIEVDDQITKPLNLANSAVLRAVEEEEQQAKCGKIYLSFFGYLSMRVYFMLPRQKETV